MVTRQIACYFALRAVTAILVLGAIALCSCASDPLPPPAQPSGAATSPPLPLECADDGASARATRECNASEDCARLLGATLPGSRWLCDCGLCATVDAIGGK
jgi:hypothetical protein